MTNPTLSSQIADLTAATQILNSSVTALIAQWKADDAEGQTLDNGFLLPRKESYDAHKTILGAVGKIQELVASPAIRLIETSCQFYESRALHIAAEHRVADLVAGAGENGVPIGQLAKKANVNADMLLRILRVLTSIGIFREVSDQCFANNRISTSLVGNESLRSYLMVFSICHYKVTDSLPAAVRQSGGSDYTATHTNTAFNLANKTDLSFWDWLSTSVQNDDGTTSPRPELDYFAKAMTGIGKVSSTAMIYDYPWKALGNGTVVDVGGGVGTHSMNIARVYPDLNFIIQDRPEVIEKGVSLWTKELPTYVVNGKVQLKPGDFFKPQTVPGASVYFLHTILHDWPDAECIQILKSLVPAMGPESRVLIGEMVINNSLGTKEIPDAPKPLPADYGLYSRYSHERDLVMLSLFNSKERTMDDFRVLIHRAGLAVTKVWECRSHMSLIECRLQG
ncbi:S-adenosyl-L-methionine-dependent methyltransferase [Aspergillus oleicola]